MYSARQLVNVRTGAERAGPLSARRNVQPDVTSPPSQAENMGDLDDEKQIILVQQHREFYDQSPKPLRDIARKADIWQAVSTELGGISEISQQFICKEEEQEVLLDQQLCNQERKSSLDQEDPGPPQIKEEQEELCTSQEGEQLVLKQETDSFMLIPTYEETEFNDQSLLLYPEQTQQRAAEDPLDKIRIKWVRSESDGTNAEVFGPNSDHQLLSDTSHVTDNQDHRRKNPGDAAPMTNTVSKPKKKRNAKKTATTNSERKPKKNPRDTTLTISTETKPTKKNEDVEARSAISFEQNPENKPYKCDDCSKSFSYLKNLKGHMRIHTGEKPFSCSHCERTFIHKSTLIRHTKTHTGEKPVECSLCGKKFAQVTEVTKHMRTHTGEKPYVCKTCGKQFSCGANMKRHMRIHTGEKPYICSDCGKEFIDSSSLKNHLRVHTGEKPYECPQCMKRFTLSATLTKHIRTHTGERPYKCNTCGNSFSQKPDLRTHIRIHTGERPYKCNVCGEGFINSTKRKNHMKVHMYVSPSSSKM